jgi:ribosomal protein L11 methyltransferase
LAQLCYPKAEFRRESTGPTVFARENWDPIFIGERFMIAPPWVDTPVPAGRFRLTIDAATAFGTGRHETTQLCLEALERNLKTSTAVVDIGCGSGILCAAAQLLGARTIFGCDIHEDAIEAAGQHTRVPLFLGSADAVCTAASDLVLANISARVLDHIAADLKRILKPAGLVILSGFLRENPPKLFEPSQETQQGEWLCWVCRRDDIHPSADASDPNIHSPDWWL